MCWEIEHSWTCKTGVSCRYRQSLDSAEPGGLGWELQIVQIQLEGIEKFTHSEWAE